MPESSYPPPVPVIGIKLRTKMKARLMGFEPILRDRERANQLRYSPNNVYFITISLIFLPNQTYKTSRNLASLEQWCVSCLWVKRTILRCKSVGFGSML